jgi:hypothetical protein
MDSNHINKLFTFIKNVAVLAGIGKSNLIDPSAAIGYVFVFFNITSPLMNGQIRE